MNHVTLAIGPSRTRDAVSGDVPPSRYIHHLHLLRGIAIMLVVGAHCWPDFAWSATGHALALTMFDNVTVVFVFISGLLFQHLSGRFRYRRYVAHRYTTVILPYAVVSIPAIVMVVFVHHRGDIWPWVYQLPVWQQVGFFLVTGKHLAPFWFIPMLALYILISPAFVAIDRRNWYPVALPVLFTLAVLLGRDSVNGMANVFGKALFMAPAYVAGMAFSRYRQACEAWCVAHRGLLGAAFLLLSALIFAGHIPGDMALPQKLALACWLVGMLADARLPNRADQVLAELARLSFAIYFVHGYVIASIRMIGQRVEGTASDEIFTGSLPGLLLEIAVVLAISVAIIRVAQMLLGRWSRYLIGA
ncbi:Peptidoglycan/LPS O-acetylase OafA/YrhL, contains acyltransferase and SGNH-hydrolase domains [Sphingomonas gellani]|uniref:Peptidoglycan/LPS O-acetylase OafA/YrhL, contains acyltransferase and SGNH-hydrolase domains n=1 Tax=Sphingomonas gellani TaxID=1166340 RepID=A0A1H7Y1G8_9SPHN|nr:acyltransferase [Sphingomonas gellani]SEM39714.1 Peptidoglycan/LPS O-acetylase OafA/YrhL, contains acyltransferase and SGNH-hydrolase domains [Sphingomonas gellani]